MESKSIHLILDEKSHIWDNIFYFDPDFIEIFENDDIVDKKRIICDIVYDRLIQKEILFLKISKDFKKIIMDSIYSYVRISINNKIIIDGNWYKLFFSIFVKYNKRFFPFFEKNDDALLKIINISEEIYREINDQLVVDNNQ